jgi:NAD(P)-dependent dehydrogenase (short-subunit alcohol dehydrogenase family)
MRLGLEGVVALVVGGTGYIGREAARSLASEGAIVVLGGRDQGRLDDAAVDVGAGTGTVVIDTRDAASVASAINSVLATHGPIGVLVNTAAPSARTLDFSRDRDPEQILNAIDGKAMGYLRCANAVIPSMTAAGFGRIINVSGQNAWLTGSVTGSVRNAAVIIAAKNLADSLAGTGVTVNTVNPGKVTDEPSTDVAAAAGGESSPQQIGALIAFLASSHAAAISGESIAVGHRVRGVAAY